MALRALRRCCAITGWLPPRPMVTTLAISARQRAYLAANGYPKSFNDLAAHGCLTASDTVHWSFEQGEQRYKTKVSGDSPRTLLEAIFGPPGRVGDRQFIPLVRRAGVPERVNSCGSSGDAHPESLAVWAVYPTSRLILAKVRKFGKRWKPNCCSIANATRLILFYRHQPRRQ